MVTKSLLHDPYSCRQQIGQNTKKKINNLQVFASKQTAAIMNITQVTQEISHNGAAKAAVFALIFLGDWTWLECYSEAISDLPNPGSQGA